MFETELKIIISGAGAQLLDSESDIRDWIEGNLEYRESISYISIA